MKQQAKIVMHEGRLVAEVVRPEACQACRACNFGQQERVYIEVGNIDCREGDEVSIEIHDGAVTKASAVAYGIPVAMLFAGLLFSGLLTDKDWLQAIFAVAGLCIGLAAVKLFDLKIRKTGRYTPRVTIEGKNK